MATTMRSAASEALARHEEPVHWRPLTVRQQQVAELIGQSKKNHEIAAALGISVAAVKQHVGGIMRKTGLDTRLKIGLWIRIRGVRYV